MILNDPFWPQKEWYSDLLVLLMKEPLKLSKLWNLLVQLYIKKFHRVLELLELH